MKNIQKFNEKCPAPVLLFVWGFLIGNVTWSFTELKTVEKEHIGGHEKEGLLKKDKRKRGEGKKKMYMVIFIVFW